ncbi:hypothetical protein ACB092_12G135600 [Castanea dentata]
MAETNAAVNQTKNHPYYTPQVDSNGSSINADGSFSGADDPIPVIDYSMLTSDDHNQRSKTMQDLQNACLEYGSFMVINHGMSDSLISRVYEALAKFFDLNEEEKKEYESNDPMDRIRWGKRDSDLVSSEFIKMAVHPTFHCPTKPAGLTEVLQECIKRLREVGIQLLRGMSKTLGFEECYIEKRMKLESGCDFITPNDYPLRPYSENQLGQAPHYDPGLLILLLPGLSNGLQLEHHGKWINANPQPNSIVVSIADQIEILTNGKYKSVFHRVVLNNNVRRISLPLFIGPSLDTMVSPLPECVDEHHPPAYLVKTYKELLEANQYHEIDVKSCLKNVRL